MVYMSEELEQQTEQATEVKETVLSIYNYNPITFEYTTKGVAERNPLDPENPLVPACATTIAPLDTKQGFAIVWIGNKWKYREDHRGETWFNKQTMSREIIQFIGEIDRNIYATLDEPIANKPDGDYWLFDQEQNKWVGSAPLYKQYISANFNTYWQSKLATPFTFDGCRYLPSWRDLYTSIWVSLYSGDKKTYRLEDFDGKFNTVNLEQMSAIKKKMSDVVDTLYTDKQNLETYFQKTNDFDKLQKAFNDWVEKEVNVD